MPDDRVSLTEPVSPVRGVWWHEGC